MKRSGVGSGLSAVFLGLALGLFLGGAAWAGTGVAGVSAGIAPCVEDLLKAFEQRGGQPVALVREATGPLAHQIDQGAPYDLLIAADPEWPQWLKGRGKLSRTEPCAYGCLTVWVPSGKAPSEAELGGLILATPDPASTSHGKMAQDFLKKEGLWDGGVAAKRILITGNAVQGVLAVKGGSAQAALIPLSLAISGGGAYRILPAGSLPVVAGVNAAGADPNALKFFAFLRSPEALPIWERWGFRKNPQ